MTAEQEVDRLRNLCSLLSNALTAALKWPYDRDMHGHIADPASIPKTYDEQYRQDIYDMRAGVNAIKELAAKR